MRRSAEVDTARPRAGRSAKPSLGSVEKRKEEIGSAARRRGTERDEARKVFVLWTALSCGSRDQDRWRTELDLGSSKSFEDYHRPTTLGAEPKRARVIGSGCFWFGLRFLHRTEQMKAKRQKCGAPPVGPRPTIGRANPSANAKLYLCAYARSLYPTPMPGERGCGTWVGHMAICPFIR